MTFDHIVVGSALNQGSDTVLKVARDLADRLEASVTVVHAVTHEMLSDMRADLPAESSFDDTIVTRLETELADEVEKVFESPTRIESKVVMGEAAPVVHQVAREENADVLVIGVRNRSRVGKLILGSTAQDLLLGSPCPVLGVPL